MAIVLLVLFAITALIAVAAVATAVKEGAELRATKLAVAAAKADYESLLAEGNALFSQAEEAIAAEYRRGFNDALTGLANALGGKAKWDGSVFVGPSGLPSALLNINQQLVGVKSAPVVQPLAVNQASMFTPAPTRQMSDEEAEAALFGDPNR